MATTITVPHNWKPREYQKTAWRVLRDGCKRAVLVWHRRAGKDLFGVNFVATELVQRVGLYWHMLPTQAQGRKVVWDGMTRDGRSFLDHFPGHANVGEDGSFCTRKRDDHMSLWFANGSKYQVVGAEDPDALVGPNPLGIIFSEFSVYDSAEVWDLMRPILAENGGFAIFIFTPRGRNHAHKLYVTVDKLTDWFTQRLGIEDTKAVPEAVIQADRDSGMSEAKIKQEYYVSWDAPLEAAYYGDLLAMMFDDKRVTSVPWEMAKPVNTFWDLGIRDRTFIWFHQQVGFQHRFINCYWSSDAGLEHYAKKLRELPYTYDRHYFPFDVTVRELGMVEGRDRVSTLRTLGIRATVVQKHNLSDGINAVRQMLVKSWMDEQACASGIDALSQYVRRRIVGEEGPKGESLYSDEPVHNWASHGADALRVGAVGLRPSRDDRLRDAQGRPKLNPDIPIV